MPFLNLHPHERLSSIFELNAEQLRTQNIKGILLDIDNTITVWGDDSLDEKTLNFIEQLEAEGFSVAFITNARSDERPGLEEPLARYPVIYDARKPMPSGYKALLKHIELEPKQVVMIGDQLFTDVFGANRLGMRTILVEPVGPDAKGFSIVIRRILERILLFFYSPA